jgi:hypothetical protein
MLSHPTKHSRFVQFFHKHILLTTGLVHWIFNAGESGSSSTWDEWRLAALTSFIPTSHIAKPTCNSISPRFLVTLFYKIEKIPQLFLFSLWEVMKWNSNLDNPKHLSGNEQHLTHSIFFRRIRSAWTYRGPTSYPLFYLGTSCCW